MYTCLKQVNWVQKSNTEAKIDIYELHGRKKAEKEKESKKEVYLCPSISMLMSIIKVHKVNHGLQMTVSLC